jgi:hypothetical protein
MKRNRSHAVRFYAGLLFGWKKIKRPVSHQTAMPRKSASTRQGQIKRNTTANRAETADFCG